MNYDSTLNLPKTDFPMRAGLPVREPVQIEAWERLGLYSKIIERNADKPRFVLHDGPPYANGDIHMGTAMNKILKDFIIRYKNMTGFRADYVPGWDTHGLPIESAIMKKQKLGELSTAEFRDKCRAFAEGFVDSQRVQFKRLGGIGNWDNPYITCAPAFEAKQVEIFGAMAKKGYIYKGLKPVYWCPRDKTALAEAEIEYKEVGNESIYVKFRVKDDKGKLSAHAPLDNIYFVIWTTTAWTLPGNLGISLNADLDYVLARAGAEVYIVAKDLLESFKDGAGIVDTEILAEMKGSEFDCMTALHPFIDRESLIMTGAHVTADSGTGCVHTAPGHGAEDFHIGRRYGLDVITPVDGGGVMTADAGPFQGMYYTKAGGAIIEHLRVSGALLAQKHIDHSYAHCWRCKHPVLFRATEQWFASVEAMKERAVGEVDGVRWFPAWGKERMSAMIRERADWCISRQRKWGVPIPIFYCEKCEKPLITEETIAAASALFAAKGSNAWFETDAADILPAGTVCGCGHGVFTKETDIMDVWFDSGSTHAAVLRERPELTWPADLYLEGTDQFRGWFQSSLLTSVAVFDRAPYRQVVTHGYIVDADGRKMSKSLGNAVPPQEIVDKYGADILRLWVSSSNYQEDVRVAPEMFRQMSDSYLKIRNTARFLLGNLNGFDPDAQMPAGELEPIDRWVLSRLNDLTAKVRDAYENYSFHAVFHALHNFCVADLSNFYLDVLKDRLYCDGGGPRLSAQTALFRLLYGLTRLMAPILCFTADEIFAYSPKPRGVDVRSVFLNDMPDCDASLALSGGEAAFWSRLIELRDAVNLELEKKRGEKLIGKSLEAAVTITADGEWYDQLKAFKDLHKIFIVSAVDLKKGAARVEVFPARGEKCARCWNYGEDVLSGLCPRCAEVVGGD